MYGIRIDRIALIKIKYLKIIYRVFFDKTVSINLVTCTVSELTELG
jgi:hypothetical protein